MEKYFYEYNLKSNLKKITQVLGYATPSDIQKEVLEQVILKEYIHYTNSNYLVISPAGSGKTFSFLLFIFNKFNFSLKKLQAIIILPTRELAYQTASYFDKINQSHQFNHNELNNAQEYHEIKYNLLVGGTGQDINNKNRKSDRLEINDETQIIVGTLGKVYSTFVNSQKKVIKDYLENLDYFVIDEADKMIHQNKQNKLKKFLQLIFINDKDKTNDELRNNISPSLLLCSASFNQKSMDFYKQNIKGLGDIKILATGEKDRQNLDNLNQSSSNKIKEYYFIFKPLSKQTYFEQKYQKLFYLLNSLGKYFKQCLIFYNQKGRGEELASDLRDQNWAVTFIHGDLNQDQRVLIYDKIRNLEVKLILATDLFSRGIDLSSVDLVINFDCAYNSTEYFHRVGRTGRYNSHGVALSFFQENEIKLLEEIKTNDEKSKMVHLNEIDDKEIQMFIYDFENVKASNKISSENFEKIKKLEFKSEETPETKNCLINKKRRRDQYEKESLVSEWIDVQEKLYDQDKFKFIQEKSEIENKCKFCLYCNLFKIFDQEKNENLNHI